MYTKPETIDLRSHPTYNEKWIQEIISEDPSVLGLGELVMRDKERPQPRAGRLDLLLQDTESLRRFEVEIQLGATDETHIIRTIEYWDIERKRYPQYEHCAVIVAEDVTSRFLNVISLFNGSIPIIAIQMNAVSVGEHTTLIFTKVLDEMVRGVVDEDEIAESAPADRNYWEEKASKQTLLLTDQLLSSIREIDPVLNLKYNKPYIGIEKDGQAFNFIHFRPRKKHVLLEVKLPDDKEYSELINEAGLDTLEYNKRWNYYRISLKESDFSEQIGVLKQLCKLAYERRMKS